MTSVLFVVAPVGFRDEELFETKGVLEEAGYTCVVASLIAGTCKGMLGASVKAVALSSLNLDDFCLIVMIGGSGVLQLLSDKPLFELFDDAYRKGLFIGAICLGPMILAKSGILRGKQATVFKMEESLAAFAEGGCAYQPDDVVCDGRVVTANGPDSSRAFAKKLLEVLRANGS